MLFTPAETKVVIVGGGTMGADVAAVCARGGCAVQVVEPTTEPVSYTHLTLPTIYSV